MRRSIEESLERLGLDRVGILSVHDPEAHRGRRCARRSRARAAARGGRREGDRLWGRPRGADGLAAGALRSGRHLCGRRYTLLDQSALDAVPPLCEAKDVSVVIGGVMNSGLLADPWPRATFDHAPADATVVARAVRSREVCARHGVSLRAAAVRFALAHPRVVSIVAGVRRVEHLEEYPRLYATPIPGVLRPAGSAAAGGPADLDRSRPRPTLSPGLPL